MGQYNVETPSALKYINSFKGTSYCNGSHIDRAPLNQQPPVHHDGWMVSE
jgi:hypothetical protein